jgi:hypothetical protein
MVAITCGRFGLPRHLIQRGDLQRLLSFTLTQCHPHLECRPLLPGNLQTKSGHPRRLTGRSDSHHLLPPNLDARGLPLNASHRLHRSHRGMYPPRVRLSSSVLTVNMYSSILWGIPWHSNVSRYGSSIWLNVRTSQSTL